MLTLGETDADGDTDADAEIPAPAKPWRINKRNGKMRPKRAIGQLSDS